MSDDKLPEDGILDEYERYRVAIALAIRAAAGHPPLQPPAVLGERWLRMAEAALANMPR